MSTRRVNITIDDGVYEMAAREARLAGVSLSSWVSRAARREAIRSDAARLAEWAERHRGILEEWATENEAETQARINEATPHKGAAA